MNRVLKYAWYQLIVVLAAIVFAGVAISLMATYWRGKDVNIVFIVGPLAIVHLFKVFFPLKAGEIAFDERDETIKKGAALFSLVVFWYAFVLSCLIPILVIGNGSIHVMYLGGLLLMAALIYRIAWSISVIVQYRRGGRNDNESAQIEGGAA
jgi:hypothetical protein